jgi:hypothetical protein
VESCPVGAGDLLLCYPIGAGVSLSCYSAGARYSLLHCPVGVGCSSN